MSLPHEHQAKSLFYFERAWHESHAQLREPLREHPGSGAALGSQTICSGLDFEGERDLQAFMKGLSTLLHPGTAAFTSLGQCSEGAERASCTPAGVAVRMPWV